LTVIVPCFNEGEYLQKNISEIITFCKHRGWGLIFIDDGSTDHTLDILSAKKDNAGYQVIHHKKNRGYGAALKSGIGKSNSEYIVTYDADGQHGLNDIEKIARAAVDSDSDLVIGTREKPGRITYRFLGKSIIKFLARILVHSKVKDLNSGLKCYRSELLKKYSGFCPDTMAFSEVMTLSFIYFQHAILEVAIEHRLRKHGKSHITTMTAVDTFFELLNIVMLFNPFRIFFPISLMLAIVSSIWAIPFLIEGHGLTTGALFGILTSILIFLMGLIAEQISKLRKDSVSEK
jgi:glycosyltransferase involved in cell wall biosynthesis